MLGASSVACLLVLVAGAVANPVQQPVYQQFYQQQPIAVPQLQYRQQPVYLGAQQQSHPVFEQADQQQQQQYVPQQPQYVPQPSQPLPQPLLNTVDRQIQKAATHIGPGYAQQIQAIQLQGQAQQAQDQVQRNALRLATAPRAQPQLQYQRALQPQPAVSGKQQLEEELQEDYNSNPSYQFGFDVKDDLYTNYQNRKEQREGDKITGSYSVVDSDGFIRTVKYTADPKEGFKAEVTRQPTDIVVKIPQPQAQYQGQGQLEQQQPQQYRQQPQQYSQQPQQYSQQPQYEEVQAAPDQGKQQQRVIYQYQ